MGKRRFLKVWIFSLMCMVAAGLVCTCAFGQISQNVSINGGDLWSSYNLDSSFFFSPFVQSSFYDSTVTSPLVTLSNQSSSYTDLFSRSWDQSNSYQNAFGFGYSAGSNLSANPLGTSGGGYYNMMAPGSLYSKEYDYSNSLWGGSSHSGNSLILPWTTFSSDITTSYGMDAWPYMTGFSGSSLSLGTPTIYSGFGRYGEGIANLMTYAPISAQLDQALGNQPMYTAEGLPFYATASYFNPYSASNYYFAPGAKISTGGLTLPGIAGSSSWVTGSAAGRIGGVAGGYPGAVSGGYTGAGGGYTGAGGGYAGAVGGGYPGAGGGYAGAVGGGYPGAAGGGYTGAVGAGAGGYIGGGYTGAGGSPAAGGVSAAGFTSIAYP